ncbi:hypothetical protein D047_0241A, partial [Vibrio parahaemolyticus VPTS-2010_2]
MLARHIYEGFQILNARLLK